MPPLAAHSVLQCAKSLHSTWEDKEERRGSTQPTLVVELKTCMSCQGTNTPRKRKCITQGLALKAVS
eukprot:500105-Amphidinium_carterae.1